MLKKTCSITISLTILWFLHIVPNKTSPVTTAIKILSRVPASTYSVLIQCEPSPMTILIPFRFKIALAEARSSDLT